MDIVFLLQLAVWRLREQKQQMHHIPATGLGRQCLSAVRWEGASGEVFIDFDAFRFLVSKGSFSEHELMAHFSSLEKFSNSARHPVPKSSVWQSIGTTHFFCVRLCVLLRKDCQ